MGAEGFPSQGFPGEAAGAARVRSCSRAAAPWGRWVHWVHWRTGAAMAELRGPSRSTGPCRASLLHLYFPPLSTLRIKTLLSLLSLGMHKTWLKQFLCSFSFVLLVGALRKV